MILLHHPRSHIVLLKPPAMATWHCLSRSLHLLSPEPAWEATDPRRADIRRHGAVVDSQELGPEAGSASRARHDVGRSLSEKRSPQTALAEPEAQARLPSGALSRSDEPDLRARARAQYQVPGPARRVIDRQTGRSMPHVARQITPDSACCHRQLVDADGFEPIQTAPRLTVATRSSATEPCCDPPSGAFGCTGRQPCGLPPPVWGTDG